VEEGVRVPRVAHVATIDVTLRALLLPQLLGLRDAGFAVSTISATGSSVPALESEGIRHIPWPHATRAWNPTADAIAFRELVSIFRRERFDLVHTHNPKPGVMGRLAARLCGVPFVANTVHGFYASPEDPIGKRAVVLGAEWLAARCSDLELYQSAEDLRLARRLGIVGEKQGVLLGNGTDVRRFSAGAVAPETIELLKKDFGIGPGDLVVGTIGRLVAEKGYREFFDAARRIHREMPRVRFLAIGDHDPAKADSLHGSELAGVSDDVTITGWRDDVRDLLALMDVFVLASWREGLPRSAIEAAAMGLPLVLTEIRGCREIVRSGVEGYLVPPRSSQALSAAILRLLRDPAERERMGSAARRRAMERFDERRVIASVIDRYRALLRTDQPLPDRRGIAV
jgi:glycosyltransferase involved in cell wall biosynthesis